MTEEQKPTIDPRVTAAAAKALAEIHERSFSGRHPELGKMIKCAVCNERHRDSIKCLPRYKELWIEEDLETGEFATVYATVPLPDQHPHRMYKTVLGAAKFKGKRRKARANQSALEIVELTRKVFPAFDGVFDDFEKQKKAARTLAVFTLRLQREQKAKKLRRQQDTSRRINRGLLRAGSQPKKFGRLDRGPRLPKTSNFKEAV
jgi:hypothetical protein